MTATLHIPEIKNQTAFNLKRWAEVCADPAYQQFEGKIETDAFGHTLMSHPPGFDHSSSQGDIVYWLRTLLPEGKTLPECPISTSDGIKAADVAWISPKTLKAALKADVLVKAPEICIEVVSPSNTKKEMMHKKALYFESGAKEVWICDLKGRLFFYVASKPDTAAAHSLLCPDFPRKIS